MCLLIPTPMFPPQAVSMSGACFLQRSCPMREVRDRSMKLRTVYMRVTKMRRTTNCNANPSTAGQEHESRLIILRSRSNT